MVNQRIPRICEHCRNGFEVSPSRVKVGKGRFCSRNCSNAGSRTAVVRRVCEQCSGEFSVRPRDIRRGAVHFCSKQCKHLMYLKVPCFCESCGEIFEVYPSAKRRRFCSRRCWNDRPEASLLARFNAGLGPMTDSGCVPWVGRRNDRGYGAMMSGGADSKIVRVTHVALALAGIQIPDGEGALHHCDNPPCVRVSHLFVGTHQDNMDDMVAKGRQMRGENHVGAKLTEHQVAEARQQYRAGGVLIKELAEAYGITTSVMTSAIAGRTWKHIG